MNYYELARKDCEIYSKNGNNYAKPWNAFNKYVLFVEDTYCFRQLLGW